MTPSAKARGRYALDKLRRAWPVVLIAFVMSAVAAYFAIRTGHWVGWASTAAPMAVILYATLYYAGSGGGLYTVDGLKVVCRPDAWVDPETFRLFVREEWYPRWREWAESNDKIYRDLVGDATIEFAAEPPTIIVPRFFGDGHAESLGLPDVDKDRRGFQAWGMTYPAARYSIVYVELALDMAGGGHELDLLAVHKARGPASEGSDIEWLKKQGVLDA